MGLLHFLKNNPIARLIVRIYNHFDTIPAAIKIEEYRFYILSNIAYTLCWTIHAIWMFVFLYLHQYAIAEIQIVSVAFHATAIVFNRKGHHITGMLIAVFEVVAHQVLIVWLIGWGAGFQYLLVGITLFPFLKQGVSMVVKSLLWLVCLGSFLFLAVGVKEHVPIYELSPIALNWFSYTNISMLFLFMAFWGFFMIMAIERTEHILLKKTQALFVAEKAAEQAEMHRQLEIKERDNEIFRLRNVELKNSNDEIVLRNKIIEEEKRRSEELLLNILPEETAGELLREGRAKSRYYEQVTVMFTDFVGFTSIAEKMTAEELVTHIDEYFRAFDEITLKWGVEKIKTIGDAYMCAGGLPVANKTHATDVLYAALDIQQYMETVSGHLFNIRIGVHTGPLVAGVVGKHKFQYDIWGDTVNVAARMEQSSTPGMINISGVTYELVKGQFVCEYRGKVNAKNKGDMDMYFVSRR